MSPSAVIAERGRRSGLTRDQVIERIVRWNVLYGEPPCTADWNPSLARWRAQEWRIARYEDGDPVTGESWPSINAAKRLFEGSFDAAIRAAGLVPHRPGPRRRAPRTARPAVTQRAPRPPRDVEAELDAAADRVLDAERRALRAEERTRRALARAERAEAALVAASLAEPPAPVGGLRRLAVAEVTELRGRLHGPTGPGPFATALRALASARARNDRTGLRRALGDVAAAAVRWGEHL
jgi:hypothetical protein